MNNTIINNYYNFLSITVVKNGDKAGLAYSQVVDFFQVLSFFVDTSYSTVEIPGLISH